VDVEAPRVRFLLFRCGRTPGGPRTSRTTIFFPPFFTPLGSSPFLVTATEKSRALIPWGSPLFLAEQGQGQPRHSFFLPSFPGYPLSFRDPHTRGRRDVCPFFLFPGVVRVHNGVLLLLALFLVRFPLIHFPPPLRKLPIKRRFRMFPVLLPLGPCEESFFGSLISLHFFFRSRFSSRLFFTPA